METHWKMAEFSELSNPMIHREQKCISLFVLPGFVNGTYHPFQHMKKELA
jgi:hypothetical protein